MYESSSLVLKELPKERFRKTWALLESGVTAGVAPGMVAGFWSEESPETLYTATVGQKSVEPNRSPLEALTVFDLASLTKVFSTATLAAQLIQRGWLNWNTPLAAVFPNYAFPEIEMRHLLSHTAGFAAWAPYWEKLREHFLPAPIHEVSVSKRQRQARQLIFGAIPEARVGARALYSDISFMLLGFALEEITGMDLDHAVEKFLWQPLGIEEAFYHRIYKSADHEKMDHVAATENSAWRGGILQGQVHDDNAWAMGGYAGHAGAFASIRDVLHFSRRLLSGFLPPEILRAAWRKVAEPAGCERTLGWDTVSGENSSAPGFSKNAVGHLGFTGTSLWMEPQEKIAVALLTNRVHPSRENNLIKSFRPRFHQAFRGELGR